MSRTLDTLLRPSLLAVAIALSAPLASTALIAAEQASSVRAYNLPAAPLASTLNQIASQAGLALTLSPALAAGKTSAPVKGQFDAPGALREALRGTGLQLEQSSAGLQPGSDSRGCGVVAADQYHRAGELRERVGAGGGLCGYAYGGWDQDRYVNCRIAALRDSNHP